MKRGQVFCRARIIKNGKDYWVNADVLDLDDHSFRAFMLTILQRNGMVVGIKEEYVEGERIELHVKKSLEDRYIKEKEGESK